MLEYDAFIRSIKQNKNVSHAVLLGAGASISSQIQSAADCIWEWKRDIYSSNNPNTTLIVSNFSLKPFVGVSKHGLMRRENIL